VGEQAVREGESEPGRAAHQQHDAHGELHRQESEVVSGRAHRLRDHRPTDEQASRANPRGRHRESRSTGGDHTVAVRRHLGAASRGRRTVAATRPRPAEHLCGRRASDVQESQGRRGVPRGRNPDGGEGRHAEFCDRQEGRARANRVIGAMSIRSSLHRRFN